MSIQHVAAVLDARDERLTGSRKLVLVTLANRTDEKGRCWPSQQLLADECGISIRAIADHLKALEADGFIKRATQHLGKGNGSRTTYTLHLASLKVAPADIAGAELAPASFVGCTGSTPHVTNHQEPTVPIANAIGSRPVVHLDQIVGKSRKPKAPKAVPDLQPALDAYNRLAERLKAERGGKTVWPAVTTFTAKRQAALKARINEHGLDAWGTVLRKAYASSFCTGAKTAWAADFEFLTSPSGFLKTLEGNYDDRTHHAPNGGGGAARNSAGYGGRTDAFDRLAERLSGGPAGPDLGRHDAPGEGEGYVIDVTPTRLAG